MGRAAIVIVLFVLLGFGGLRFYGAQHFRQNLAAAGYQNVKPAGFVDNFTNKATAPFHGCTIGFTTAPKGTKPRTIKGHTVTAFVVSQVSKTGKWTALAIKTPTLDELGAYMAAHHVNCKG